MDTQMVSEVWWKMSLTVVPNKSTINDDVVQRVKRLEERERRMLQNAQTLRMIVFGIGAAMALHGLVVLLGWLCN